MRLQMSEMAHQKVCQKASQIYENIYIPDLPAYKKKVPEANKKKQMENDDERVKGKPKKTKTKCGN